MGKIVGLVVVAIIAFAYFHSGPRRAPQPAQAADPIADMQARLKAEQARLHAEDEARGKASRPVSAPAPRPAGPNWQAQNQTLPAFPSSPGDDCARARNNVEVTSQWMNQGGTVYEKGSGKTLSENQSFDAAARNRQFLEDNCRGR